MTELEKLIKTAVYGSVGAIATIAEKSGELLQVFVDKGEEVVRQGQTVTEEAVKKFKEVWEEADIDVSHMTQEQREALRRRQGGRQTRHGGGGRLRGRPRRGRGDGCPRRGR